MFKENGMHTFADWLCYYNNLDVAPGLEALEKIRTFYSEKGIDILKDAVSISRVSLHYLLQGAVEQGSELYGTGIEEYDMLKEAVVEGAEPRFHKVQRGGCNTDQVSSGQRAASLQKNRQLRRQRSLSFDHAQRNAAHRGVQTAGKQHVQEDDRSSGAANERDLHQRQEGGRQDLAERIFL